MLSKENIRNIYPLTPMQEGMFFHALHDPDSSAYFEQTSNRLHGPLDIKLVEKSLEEVVRRYDILRTVFSRKKSEKLLQIVLKERPIDVLFEDISHMEDKEAYVEDFRKRDRKNVFDLTKDMLLRVSVLKIGEKEYEFIWSHHHILMDGWCVGILISEFNTFYRGFLEGTPVQLPPPAPFSRYINWLQKQDKVQSERYWRDYVADYDETASLPHLAGTRTGDDYDPYRIIHKVDPDVVRRLHLLLGKNQVTMNILVQCVWGILLGRYARYPGKEDVIFGTVVSGRPSEVEGIETMVGLFVNTVPMRIRFKSKTTFSQLLQDAQQSALEGEPFHHFSLSKTQSFSTLRQNLFDHLTVFQNTPDGGPRVGLGGKNKEARVENVETKTYAQSSFDFNLLLVPGTGDRFFIRADFNANAYDSEFVRGLLRQVEHLLTQVVELENPVINELSFLPEEDKKQVLEDFNDTAVDYAGDKTLHRLFEEQVQKTPGNIAAAAHSAGDNTTHMSHISYKELNDKADRLAGVLIEKGVTPDTAVALVLRPSLHMPVGILGVLKAGGAYVPIDPEYPPARIDYILADSDTKILVTTRSLSMEAAGLESWAVGGREIIYLEDHEESITGHDLPQPAENAPAASSENLAYIVYTSGTTGKPKGVAVEHRGIANFVSWRISFYGFTEEDATLQLLSYAFDGFAANFYPPLLSGGKLVFPAEKDTDYEFIRKVVKEEGVTNSALVPGMYQLLLDTDDVGCLTGMRFVVLAAEKAPGHLLETSLEKLPSVRLFNEYGPTEASVGATANPGLEPGNTAVIGKPIGNVRIYILDAKHNPVPVGMQGELCIAGVGVARGYLNRPELTVEKFTPLPLLTSAGTPGPSTPIYKTGDLARRLPDGSIEFLGRIDSQVKIRGYRVELGEIENQLSAHEAVKEALVTAETDASGTRYLCAYVVLVGPDELSGGGPLEAGALTGVLSNYLSLSMPDYMIPNSFVLLDKFPLNAAGKIDRKALPDPLESGLTVDAVPEYHQPHTVVEKLLVDAWEDVLGRETVGIDENFFAIGGDSIKSIQVSSRMNQAGYTVEMKDIFSFPTIAQLAPHVKKRERVAEQGPITGTVPLTPIQARFFREEVAQRGHFNQSVMLFSPEGYTEEALRAVFGKIQEHHDTLRMTFKIEDGQVTQTIQELDYPLSLRVFDFRNRADAVDALTDAANEVQASIDLENGPLMKLGLFRLDDGDRLLIVIHHLVVDGVSWRILFQDIGTLFEQFKNGEPLELPLKSDSFKYWAERLRQYADSPLFLKEKDYWARIEASGISPIPVDFPDASNCKKDAVSGVFLLEEEATDRLLTKVNHAFNTEINDILLTALTLAVRETFGVHGLLLALEGHGREDILEDIHINRTVGWFTSVYPVLLTLAEDGDEVNLERQIKEVKEALRRVPKKGIGYGVLKYLSSESHRDGMVFNLEPQVSFNYMGQFGTDVGEMPFSVASEPKGREENPEGKREFELDVSGQVSGGQLQMSVSFNPKRYKEETIERLLKGLKKNLLRLIDFCADREKTCLTPFDFTYKQLTIDEVDSLTHRWEDGIADIYPLAPMQEGMLFHALYESSSTAYFMQMSYRLHGEIDVSLVGKSFDQLFRRYDILRTHFIHEALDRPLQVVRKHQPVDFHYRDISQLPSYAGDAQRQDAYVESFKARDRQRLFDLTSDVLMRLAVIRTDSTEFEFVWSFHHILMDGWCLGILIKEFFDIYNGLVENKPRTLPPVTSYVTYVRWLEKQDKDAAQTHWSRYLENYDAVARVPAAGELKSADDAEYKHGRAVYRLEPDKQRELAALAARNHVTLNILVQVAWGIVLGRYNRVRDVVFGAVVSGRPAEIEGVETMVGLFINTIPVRIAYQPGITLHKLLRKIQDEAIESEPFHHYPLASAQNLSPLKQNLLDHIIVFENYPLVEQLDGMIGGRDDNGTDTGVYASNAAAVDQTNYDFNLLVSPGGRLSIEFKYNGNVYDETDIHRIAGHLFRVLDQFVEDADAAVDSLSLMSEEEKQKVLVEFNNTTIEYPEETTIHRLFEEQARKTPENTAVAAISETQDPHMSHKTHMTYKELDEKSNQLARRLQEKGVTAGSITAVMAEPSMEMITGILAILKAGSSYLPIDPEFPEARIKYMLNDSSAGILLTKVSDESKVNEVSEHVEVIDLNKIDKEIELLPVDSLTGSPSQFSSDNFVYVIYTSGTTGKPKGVLLSHRNLVNYVHWFSGAARLTPEDRVLLVSSFAFDLGYTAVYPSLLNGSQLHVVSKDTYLLPETALNYIEEHRITYIKTTPSLFTLLVNSENFTAEKFSALRLLVLGGEAINLKDVETVRRVCGDIEVMNHYGPTEATIGCIAELINFDRFDSYLRMPTIGRPINNTRVYILDGGLRTLPLGAAGELCIAGDCLAAGYLNQPELTAERFAVLNRSYKTYMTSEPHAEKEKLYKTGDLACRMADGRIRFLGRIDQQVKIKGYRIELEEIANRLKTHEDIEETVVIDRSGDNGDKYLCAYIVAGGEQVPGLAQLRDHLARELPDYMIPAFFVPIEEIPLTANNKLDRAALPEPDQSLPTGEDYAAPRNDIEGMLCDVWEAVLGRSPVGVEDNFFMLGGDSIKSIQIVSRMAKGGYKVEIRDIFANPSISQLAPLVREAGPAADQSAITGIVPLTPIQEEFFEKSLERPHFYNMSFMLNSPEGFDPEITEWVFTRLQEHHDALRVTFTRGADGEIIQTTHGTDYPVDVRVIDFRNREDAPEALMTTVNEIQAGIDLENGPIMRVGIMRMDDGDRLLMAVHHLVMDGVSWRILFEDIEHLYHHYRTHKKDDPPQLPLKTDSFKRWSEQLVQYADSPAFLKEKRYWARLEDTTGVGVIPEDFEGGRNRIMDTNVAGIQLDREDTERLLTKVNEAFGTEINDILLTALGLAVQEQYGHDRLLIAQEGHGREDILQDVDISRTVGWFTSRYPVVFDFSQHSTASHFEQTGDEDMLARQIKEVKETLRRVPNKGVGHGILKYLTSPENKTDVQFRLKPRINFNYLGQFDADVEHMSFEPAKEGSGRNAHPSENNAYQLSINGLLAQNQLGISINYSKEQFKKETIESLLECYKAKLIHIISYCSERRKKEITPSDLTYSELSIEAVDSIDALFD